MLNFDSLSFWNICSQFNYEIILMQAVFRVSMCNVLCLGEWVLLSEALFCLFQIVLLLFSIASS